MHIISLFRTEIGTVACLLHMMIIYSGYERPGDDDNILILIISSTNGSATTLTDR